MKKAIGTAIALTLLAGSGLMASGTLAGDEDPGDGPSVAPQRTYASDWSVERGPVSVGPVRREGRFAVRLTARPAVVDQGSNVGIGMTNRGKVRIGWGYGETLQRRIGGRWRPAWDAYRDDVRAYPDILLSLGAGDGVGPDGGSGFYGSPNVVTLGPDAKPGRYRVVKEVMPFRGNWPEDEVRVSVEFRIADLPQRPPTRRELSSNVGVRRTGPAAARLWLDRDTARAGETLSLSVENLGGTVLGFRKGGDVHGWSGRFWELPGRRPGEWVPDDIGIAPAPDIRVEPGRFEGPDHGQVADRVRVPKNAQPGLYSVTKGLLARADDPRRSPTFDVSAWFRVIE